MIAQPTNSPRTLREIIVECLRITTDRDPVVSFYLPKGWELLEAELAAYVCEREAAVREKAAKLLCPTCNAGIPQTSGFHWPDTRAIECLAIRVWRMPLPSDEATP